jgi:hypothetical protein
MFQRVEVLAAVILGVVLGGCSSTPTNDQERRVVGETVTGSNIPRRESSVKSGVTTVEKDSVESVFQRPGPIYKPGG